MRELILAQIVVALIDIVVGLLTYTVGLSLFAVGACFLLAIVNLLTGYNLLRSEVKRIYG